MTIGEKIRQFRKDNLLTLRQAAKVFGVSSSEITRLESQKNQPHFITVAKWEKLLDEAKKKGEMQNEF
jgi:transcriptional regulator with XRE-family HTH domain